MAELKVQGGPDTGAIASGKGPKALTVALTFVKPDEVEVYNSLQKLADEKDYTLSKLIVRVLTGKETFDMPDTHNA